MTANRQILLVENAARASSRPSISSSCKATMPEPKDGEVLVRVLLHLARRRQPRLDAGRDLSLGGRGQHGDGRRRRGRGGRVEGAGPCQGRPRVRRHRLAGLCRAAGKAPDQAPADRAPDPSAQRLRHRRADRLFRPAAMSAGRRPARPWSSRRRQARSARSSARSPRSRAATSSASPAARRSATG